MTASEGEDPSKGLVEGILAEISRFEKINAKLPQETSAGPGAAAKPPAVPFVHLKGGEPGSNPAFAPGVEFALLEKGRKLEELTPPDLAAVAPVLKETLLATRNPRRKADLAPGENVYSKSSSGAEEYIARVEGVAVIAGGLLHVLPSDADGRASVRVASDNLAVFLDLLPAYGRGRPCDYESIMQLLQRMRVRYGILESLIKDGLARCARGQPVRDIPAAKGIAPRSGETGSVEYFFDRDFQGPVNLTVGPDGKIDFRNVTWIPLVKKDQLLARVTPSKPGQDGMDVFGNAVPARQPQQVYLVSGENVRATDTEFFSEIDGCVQLNGTLLAVMNVYVVNSDVDYRSGNVKFEGNVVVTGAVRQGFEVQATGDVVVLKNAEPCRIKAGRDVFIHGGVLGGGKGEFRVEAGRNITAGYAENAWLEAQGDIRVEDFSLQSFLYSCGRILLEKRRGSLVGGEAVAARGLEAKSLGSRSGVRTLVVAGVDFVVKRQLGQLEQQHAALHAAALKVDRMIKTLLEQAGKTPMAPAKVEALRDIAGKRKLMAKAMHAAKVRMAELELMREPQGHVAIKVTEAAFPEVTLAIRNAFHKVAEIHYRSLYQLDPKGQAIVRRPA